MYSKKLALTGICLMSSLTAMADNVGFGSPDAVPNQLARDELSWGSFKQSLADKGVKLSVDYSAIGFEANDTLPDASDRSAGGMVRFYGQWTVSENDQGNSGSLIWKVEHRHSYTDTSPKEFLFGAGALGLEVPPFSDEGGRLTNLYWKQRFNGGRGTIVAGHLDSTDYFDVYALASPWTGFTNFAFSTGTTTVALPGDAAVGVAAAHMLGKNFFIIGGLTDMNSDPTDPLESWDSFFNDNKYFKSIELGWTSGREQIYTDNVHLSVWHADESEVQGTDDGWGVNLSASRLWGQWLPFVRAGWSEDAGTLFEKSISIGTGFFGLGDPNNNLGVAMNWANVEGGDDQYTTEVYYLIKPMHWLEVTPDIQWIRNPALNPGRSNLMVVGLRGRIVL